MGDISDSSVAPDVHAEPFKTSILKPFGAENGLCSPRTTADYERSRMLVSRSRLSAGGLSVSRWEICRSLSR